MLRASLFDMKLWFCQLKVISQFRNRLFTVPYFFVRSLRYSASFNDSHLGFQMYRGGGRRSRRSYGKIEDCEQSSSVTNKHSHADVLRNA